MLKQMKLVLLLLVCGPSLVQGMELTQPSNSAGAVFDPYIVDYSQKSCKANILNLIKHEAQKCGLGNEKFSLHISDQIANWGVWSSENINVFHVIPEIACQLNALLQIKNKIKLTKEKHQFVNKQIMSIRHELGHVSDAKKIRAIIPTSLYFNDVDIAPYYNEIVSGVIFLGCYLAIPKKNFIHRIVAGSLSFGIASLLYNVMPILYRRIEEMRADNFSIRRTQKPDELKAAAKFFKNRHLEQIRTNDHLWHWPSFSDHPSDYLRYKKFQYAYKQMKNKTKQNH